MSDIYKHIIKSNFELRNTKNLEQVFDKISEYMKNKFDICRFKVLLENNNHSEILFESSKEEIENNFKYKTKINITQNEYIEINYLFYTKELEEFKVFEEKEDEVQLIFEEFSQTIYIRYLEMQNDRLSLIDNVTGLHNRHYLDNYIENILNISNREQKKVGFLKVSIDKFKAVIDEFDYAIGDKVLRALADSLVETVRSSDIVLRFEGGDFLVILLNVINEENAMMIAQKIIDNFREVEVEVNPQTKQTLKKTLCVGLALYPDDAASIDDILKKSDVALYEAKNKGRNQIYKYKEEEINTIDFF